MILRHVCDKPFMIGIPDRSESKEGFQPNWKGANLVHRWLQGK
jgi:hypothetical protein